MLPHVDELRPIHNLDSMTELVRALSGRPATDYDPKAMFGTLLDGGSYAFTR